MKNKLNLKDGEMVEVLRDHSGEIKKAEVWFFSRYNNRADNTKYTVSGYMLDLLPDFQENPEKYIRKIGD
ncbi:MAG: hypothetical protein AAB875_05900 [Patescibacteria group bacterium]